MRDVSVWDGNGSHYPLLQPTTAKNSVMAKALEKMGVFNRTPALVPAFA